MCLGMQQIIDQVLGSWYPPGRSRINFWLLAPVWSSPGCCGHLKSKSADRSNWAIFHWFPQAINREINESGAPGNSTNLPTGAVSIPGSSFMHYTTTLAPSIQKIFYFLFLFVCFSLWKAVFQNQMAQPPSQSPKWGISTFIHTGFCVYSPRNPGNIFSARDWDPTLNLHQYLYSWFETETPWKQTCWYFC